jgi:hypothetical protein
LVYFDEAVRLLDRYYWRHRRAGTAGFDASRVLEIRLRLRQLSFLHAQAEAEEKEAMTAWERAQGQRREGEVRIFVIAPLTEPGDPDVGDYELPSRFVGPDRLQLYGEAFYYVAHRILVLIRQSPDGLPGLQGLKADGVSRVRNNLLEHANKKGGSSVASFSISSAAGMRLRPVVADHNADSYLDEGLRANAREFRDNLTRKLSAALEL